MGPTSACPERTAAGQAAFLQLGEATEARRPGARGGVPRTECSVNQGRASVPSILNAGPWGNPVRFPLSQEIPRSVPHLALRGVFTSKERGIDLADREPPI